MIRSACIEAARLAIAYRQRFKLDYLIDLVGYRRYGHNEGDEPAFTQPQIYQIVAAHPTVREKYATSLIETGAITQEEPTRWCRRGWRRSSRRYASVKPEQDYVPPVPEVPPSGAAKKARHRGAARRAAGDQRRPAEACPKASPCIASSNAAANAARRCSTSPSERTIDWAAAEELAMATILADGVPIRFTGEDVERGTFSHRHAVYHDAVTGEEHVPLQTLPQAKASFEIRNSPLSEYACVGFELGYNLQEPARLVLWEAQYGDFINGAQIILDEYLTSGRAKWGMSPSLVLLLPHGYEGQGPDHSSARLERFLNAAADTNMRIVNCTTAAQYFHLLRRQALLLEDGSAAARRDDAEEPAASSVHRVDARGARRRHRSMRVIDDAEAAAQPAKVRRLVLCSGKIAVDLLTSERRKDNPNVAVVRVEQLYPFPADAIEDVIERYPKRARGVLGPGRAGEHGRVGIRAPASSSRSSTAGMAAALHRPLAQLESVGRIVELARRQPARHRRSGIRSEEPRRASSIACCRSKCRDRIGMSTNIVVPELGESVVEARVAKWLKKQGDRVSMPAIRWSSSRPRRSISRSAPIAPGVLADIKHQEGADVKVGEVLAVLEESTERLAAAPHRCQRFQRCQTVPKGSGSESGSEFRRQESDTDREECREGARREARSRRSQRALASLSKTC